MSEYTDVIDLNQNRGATQYLVERPSPYLDRVGLSWIAYLRLGRVVLIGLFLVGIAQLIAERWHIRWLGNTALLVALVWLVYKIAHIRSVYLFTDPAGVWLSSGVFPWQKGCTGLQWRDVGAAGYHKGFVSWLFKSYKMDVHHRFTQATDLSIKDLRYGHLVAEHINRIVMGINWAK